MLQCLPFILHSRLNYIPDNCLRGKKYLLLFILQAVKHINACIEQSRHNLETVDNRLGYNELNSRT